MEAAKEEGTAAEHETEEHEARIQIEADGTRY